MILNTRTKIFYALIELLLITQHFIGHRCSEYRRNLAVFSYPSAHTLELSRNKVEDLICVVLGYYFVSNVKF